MRYEMIREIFNDCSNSQMRDVSISTVDTDDIDRFTDAYRSGKNIQEQRTTADGSIVFDIVADGLHQRITFSEDN